MPINQLFMFKPDINMVQRIVRTFGIRDLNDMETEFNSLIMRDLNTVRNLQAMANEIKSYYLPCKAAKFLSNGWTYRTCIILLRHFIRLYGLTLAYREKIIGGRKYNIYKITFKREKNNGNNGTRGDGKYYINFD